MEGARCPFTSHPTRDLQPHAYFSQHFLISTRGNLARLKNNPALALWNLPHIHPHVHPSRCFPFYRKPSCDCSSTIHVVWWGSCFVLFSSIVLQELVTQRPHPQLGLFILKLSQRNQMLWRSSCLLRVSLETLVFGGHLEDGTWKCLAFLSLC